MAGHACGRRRRLRSSVALAVTLAAIAVGLPASMMRSASAAPARVHVVIALVGEVGVNPYQRDFAAPTVTANPRTWLPGYPAGAAPLRLHLNQPVLSKAIAADDATWRSIKAGRLYYIPGTRLVGVVYLPSPLDRSGDVSFDSNNPAAALQPARPIIG